MELPDEELQSIGEVPSHTDGRKEDNRALAPYRRN